MKQLDRICWENGLIYWLDFDTLLGAIRHKGFVPWVCDATIGMPRPDADKLVKLLSHDQDICAEDEYTVVDGIFRRRLQVRYRNIESGNQFFCVNIHLFDYCRDDSMALWNKHITLRKAFNTEFDRLSKSKTLISQANSHEKCLALFKAHKTKNDKAIGISQVPAPYVISAFDNPAVGDAVKYCYRIADMFPLENISFEGYNFQAPVCPEKFILKQYMDMYDIPDDMLPDIDREKNNEIYQGLEYIFDKYHVNIENIK
ncbi:MAG: LicD family protein [Oscillospiraceae bacterium]|nr:LicD family protein [Oscillospiraceae bacterium]